MITFECLGFNLKVRGNNDSYQLDISFQDDQIGYDMIKNQAETNSIKHHLVNHSNLIFDLLHSNLKHTQIKGSAL
ncbi:UNKNOWN [Stylonychia lemnae]|uniref:Uncharacterized protein n=1 Tax=Stylonychia lemnae TaxID=5949 RepID=A0A078AQ57_STYLE|nr:UNKNOWN [Stylonychia lemnae]|eukprot:CDW84106.1 UNKNOWN [Stylonychia lemnae]